MGRYRIGCNVSHIDNGDIDRTIAFNRYGTKNVIYHWSDLTIFKAYHHVFIAHNIYFAWGNIHHDYHSTNHFIDEKINVGCIFKEEYNKALNNKENIIAQIAGLRRDRGIVTFFDVSFCRVCHFTEDFFLAYLEMIKEFCERNKDVNVLLVPKKSDSYHKMITPANQSRFKETWDGLMRCDNFRHLNQLQWSMEEIIAISDVCINMGMNSPATVALICGKNALYFDETGNEYHPFAKKYRNIIVFEDKDLLFQQISNILNGEFDCKDVISEREIREFDTFSDNNALERIRENLYELTLSS